ncbi:MAG: hypothetical protein ACKOX3_04295 [Bacteroidota bacterium]
MKKYVLVVGLIFQQTISLACDVCGCYTGVLPYENKNSIAIYSRYRAFKNDYYVGKNDWFPDGSFYKTEHGVSSTEKVSGYEVFRALEIRGRLFFKPKWELNFNLPYIKSVSSEGLKKEMINGVGDFSLNIYRHFASENCNKQCQNRLILGGGFKLPTGRNDFLTSNGQRAELYNQPGTGSLDYNLMANYALGYKQAGFSASTNFRYNSTNSFNEKLCSIINFSSMLFYKIKVSEDWMVVPSVIGTFEKTRGVRIGNNLQIGTSMQLMMMGAGWQLIYKRIALDSQLLLPFDDPKSINSQRSTIRIVIGFIYNI